MSHKGPAPIQSAGFNALNKDPQVYGAIKTGVINALQPGSDDAYSQIATDRLLSATRGGFAARGLVGSGIAQRSEQDAVSGLQAQLAQQKMGLVPQILGAASGVPAQQQQSTPRGLFGLK